MHELLMLLVWGLKSSYILMLLFLMYTLQALPTPPRPAFAIAKLYKFLCKMSFFGNDDHYRHKNQQMSCTLSVHVCVQNFAVVQRGV